MLLQTLFNRFSKVVVAMEIVGICLMPVAVYRLFNGGFHAARFIFCTLVILQYAFLKYCSVRRFYTDAPRYSGIELNFKKLMVPANYILAIFSALTVAFPSAWIFAVAAALLAVLTHVNIVLLYLKSKDADPTPVNHFTSGRFLSNG